MKFANFAIIAAVALGQTGCANRYFERSDTIAFSAGDAVASNSAVQVPDPWPKGSQDTKIPMDPVKAGIAMYKYRCGDDNQQSGSSGFDNNGSGFDNNGSGTGGGAGSAGMGGGSGAGGGAGAKGGYC